jgi:hypothetical protein
MKRFKTLTRSTKISKGVENLRLRSVLETEETWKVIFDQEIENAQAARSSGNEGKARVCARRAAGVVAREYFARRNERYHLRSAYQNLQTLRDHPDTPQSIRQITGHFLERITEEHELPSDADLIVAARRLAAELLDEF